MRTQYRQQGISFIGLLIVCALIGFFALLGMKLFPLYMEKFKVVQSLQSVAKSADIRNWNYRDIQKALLKNFEVQDIDQFTETNIKQYLTVTNKKDSGERVMTMDYESRQTLTADLDVVLKFHYSLDIPGAASE